MNREEALRWCVESLSEWPRLGHNPKPPADWYWIVSASDKTVMLTAEGDASIREEDWRAARAPTEDLVNHPKHYQLLPGVEVYDIRQALAAKATAAGVTLDQFSDYDRAIEYLLRMWEKNGKQDAEKAVWYLEKLIGKLQS